MTYTKEFLSGSTNGRPISVTAIVAGSANTAHTAHATSKDEIWLWATNTSASAVDVTVCLGGTAAGDLLTVSVPAKTTIQLLPGTPVSNSLVTGVYASTTAVVNVFGFVNRIT